MTKTTISWTEQTWNPIVGCSVVSPGCTNCYAMREAWRFGHNPKLPQYHGLTQMTKGGSVWNGKVALAEKALLAPLKRRKPTMYFVNSMGDLFHEHVPDDWIDRVFAVMALCPQHTFQVLTKRSQRMRTYMAHVNAQGDPRAETIGWAAHNLDWKKAQDLMQLEGSPEDLFSITPDWPLRNVWLGVSAEDQTRADERIPDLLNTPAAIRFVSAEPLLGPVDFCGIAIDGDSEMDALSPALWRDEIENWEGTSDDWQESFMEWYDLSEMPESGTMHPTLNWVITGGESGPNARPMHPDWARNIRDQCAAAGVAFHFKQWGEWGPSDRQTETGIPSSGYVNPAGKTAKWPKPEGFGEYGPHDLEKRGFSHMTKFGKARAGRLLDGRTHDDMPEGRL